MTAQSLARQAVRLFPHSHHSTRKAVNALRRGWMEKIAYLGPRWLMAPENRIAKKEPL